MISLQMETLRKLGTTEIAATYLLISRAQYRVFQIAHYVSPLSILGSLAIIYRIVRFDRHDPDASSRRTYHRLFVAMSICDVLGTVALMFGPTLIPRETLLETARGNTATCTAQGFFMHIFVLPVLYYNAGLMLYFVVTIRYGWSESRVSKWLEPFVHAWALVVPFGQGVAGLFLHIFNPIGYGNFCYISPYPLLCGVFAPCTRGQSAHYLYLVFCTGPEAVALVIIYVSIVLIYCAVRKQAQRALSITANRESVLARTKAVAVQSCLFALIFFNTWLYTVLAAVLTYTVKRVPTLIKSEYILSVMTSTFLPLQGFFTFCVFIRPRFTRLWVDQQMPFCSALKVAITGGRESISPRKSSKVQLRKRSSQSFTQSSLMSAQIELRGGASETISGDIIKNEKEIDKKEHLAASGSRRDVREDCMLSSSDGVATISLDAMHVADLEATKDEMCDANALSSISQLG